MKKKTAGKANVIDKDQTELSKEKKLAAELQKKLKNAEKDAQKKKKAV